MKNLNQLTEIVKAYYDSQVANGKAKSDPKCPSPTVAIASLPKHLLEQGLNWKEYGVEGFNEFLRMIPKIRTFRSTLNNGKYGEPRFYILGENESDAINNQVSKEETMAVNRSTAKLSLTRSKQIGLFDWAYIAEGFDSFVEKLAEIALLENWGNPNFDGKTKSSGPILKSYIIYTFIRLYNHTENGVIEKDDYAAFNTGLVDDFYEPIFALFDKNKNTNRQKWHFCSFCTSAGKNGGKTIACFNPKPPKAQYFEDPIELFFDANIKPQLSYEHIIIDRIDRLPIDFLLDNLPKEFSEMNDVKEKDFYLKAKEHLKDNSNILRRFKNRLDDSLDLALKKASWNYKTAIPMYYPKRNKMSLLLPLSLVDDDRIDLALITERTEEGTYIGHTVISLSWAYMNSRLITRPDSDWLDVRSINPNDDGEDSIEQDS